jgi:pimeloyl-ACP methyl ester carboxylesterase
MLSTLALFTAMAPAMVADLPRKPALGISFASGTNKVQAVSPGLSADGNLKAGDEIRSVRLPGGEGNVASAAEIIAKMVGAKTGDRATFVVVREGKEVTVGFDLKERPREVSPDYDVIYSQVLSNGNRIRTIITKPKKAGKFPVFMMIQGLGGFSMDFPLSGQSGPYIDFLRHFAKQDFVTLRVEKPGMGDAEGGPYSDTDFMTEEDVYLQAVRAIKKELFVNADQVFIFGHSMGGTFGPRVVSQEPVRGFITASTLYKTWAEYWLENLRRQVLLGGASQKDTDDLLVREAVVGSLIRREGWSPKKVAEQLPQYKDYVASEYPDENRWQGRTFGFWRQLAQLNMADNWTKVECDVLSLWGEFDFVSTEEDQKMIVNYLNKKRPGSATYERIEKGFHGFELVESYEDAFRRISQPKPIQPEVIEVMDAWIKARLK